MATRPGNEGMNPLRPLGFRDIIEPHAVAGNLWVFTSARSPTGIDQQADAARRFRPLCRQLLPSFPESGVHRSARNKSLITDDGFLVLPEQEDDGLVSIGNAPHRRRGPVTPAKR